MRRGRVHALLLGLLLAACTRSSAQQPPPEPDVYLSTGICCDAALRQKQHGVRDICLAPSGPLDPSVLGFRAIPGNQWDRDRDGYDDGSDCCPFAPEDFDGVMDEDGCPDCDNNLDGVPEIDLLEYNPRRVETRWREHKPGVSGRGCDEHGPPRREVDFP